VGSALHSNSSGLNRILQPWHRSNRTRVSRVSLHQRGIVLYETGGV
jgi:hypothetical protein